MASSGTGRTRRTKAQMEQARRRSESAHRHHLKARHNMTPEQYAELLERQGGSCFICQRAKGVTRRLAVDHDHAIGFRCAHPDDESCQHCWRGLLCSPCNKTLAHARDDMGFFLRAMSYLNDPPARR